MKTYSNIHIHNQTHNSTKKKKPNILDWFEMKTPI